MEAVMVKEHMTEIIQAKPDDSSYDEILRELIFKLMIESGLEDSCNGQTIKNEETKRRIQSC